MSSPQAMMYRIKENIRQGKIKGAFQRIVIPSFVQDAHFIRHWCFRCVCQDKWPIFIFLAIANRVPYFEAYSTLNQ